MPCEEFDYLNLVNVREGDVMPNSFLAVPVGLTHKLFRFSGIICHNFVGQSGDWRRYTATVTLPNMGLNWVSASQVDTSQNRLAFEHGAATVFLASISNNDNTVNAGWAVDRVIAGVTEDHLSLRISLAVRDSDGFIARLGYRLDILARTSL
jgi:hypothetical protein